MIKLLAIALLAAPNIGINVDSYVSYLDADYHPEINVLKSGLDFRPLLVTGQLGERRDLQESSFNDKGYPVQNIGAYLATYETGPWVLVWSGSGTITPRNPKNVSSLREVSPGRWEFNVDQPELTSLRLDFTPGVENAACFPARFEETYRQEIFRPEYIGHLQTLGVKTLRFMNTGNINENPSGDWGRRTTVNHLTYYRTDGAPLERMIDLCNRIGADMWYCLPDTALPINGSGSYAEHAATMIAARLNPDLLVYVEYSNEIWNTQFGQSQRLKDQGGVDPRINALVSSGYISSADTHAKRIVLHGIRTAELGEVFERVLGEERAIVTLGAQQANIWTLTKPGEALVGGVPLHSLWDAVAIAPYIGHLPATDDGTMSWPDYAAFANNDMRTKRWPDTDKHFAKAAEWELIPVGYEGGMHAHHRNYAGIDASEEVSDVVMTNYRHWFSHESAGTLVHFKIQGIRSAWGTRSDSALGQRIANFNGQPTPPPIPPVEGEQFTVTITASDGSLSATTEVSVTVPLPAEPEPEPVLVLQPVSLVLETREPITITLAELVVEYTGTGQLRMSSATGPIGWAVVIAADGQSLTLSPEEV